MSLTITTPGELSVVTLDQVKQHLGQSADLDDDLIWLSYVPAAEAWAASFTRGPVRRHTYTQIVAQTAFIRAWPQGFMLRGAVSSLVVKYRDDVDGTLQTVAATVYDLLAARNTAWVVLSEGQEWPSAGDYIDAWQLSYEGGWTNADVPDEIRTAVMLKVQQFYDGDVEAGRAAEALLTPFRLMPW